MKQESARKARRRAFGNVKQLPSGRYLARYTAPDGTARAVKGTFATKSEADSALNRIRIQQEDRLWIDPRSRSQTLSEYLPTFLANRRNRQGQPVAPKTRQLADWHLRAFILPAFGDRRLDQITREEVTTWHGSLECGAAVKRQLYSLLHAIFTMAVSDGLVRENPCRIRGAGQVPEPNRPYFTLAQAEKVIEAMEGPEKLVAQIAFHAQLRIGEALALRWADVDLDARTLHVRRSVTESYNAQHEAAPKGGRSRFIGIDDDLVTILRATPRRPANARVAVRSDGAVMRHWHVTTVWQRARKAVDLEHFTLHDLRAAGATALSYEGVPLRAVMDHLGHSTTNAALHYQRRAETLKHVQAQAFERALARSRAERDTAEVTGDKSSEMRGTYGTSMA